MVSRSIDQAEVIAFLASPSTHGGSRVERIETHASVVFLAGDRALKLKRAVHYDYLDYSSAARRKAMCEAELRINRSGAPGLYRGVVAVTRTAGGTLALGGPGEPVDWLVEMTRFDQDLLFERLAARGALPLDLMGPLAAAVARFHDVADRCPGYGGSAGIRRVIEGNALGFAEQGAVVLEASSCAALSRHAMAALDRLGPRLDAREHEGCVRRCHGDLHLRNIVLLDGQPRLFDAIEFNDDMACIDVLYDLAFLLMDLWHRGLRHHANAVWNGYLSAAGHLDAVALLPLLLSCRAAIRAKTSTTAARLQPDRRAANELARQAEAYLTLARQLLNPPAPCLVAIGGFSASGKSTLARSLAAHIGAAPGAVVIRSDEVRKRLCGVDPLQRLGPEGYAPEVSRRVYATIADQARQVAAGGHAVIVDAVCARPADREAVARAAATAGVPMVGLWLEAAEPVLIERAAHRGPDASDADAAVIHRQFAEETGSIPWSRVDASKPFDTVLAAATEVLAGQCIPR